MNRTSFFGFGVLGIVVMLMFMAIGSRAQQPQPVDVPRDPTTFNDVFERLGRCQSGLADDYRYEQKLNNIIRSQQEEIAALRKKLEGAESKDK